MSIPYLDGVFFACECICVFLGSRALLMGRAAPGQTYASVIVTAIGRDGIAQRACIPDEAIERAPIKASGIET